MMTDTVIRLAGGSRQARNHPCTCCGKGPGDALPACLNTIRQAWDWYNNVDVFRQSMRTRTKQGRDNAAAKQKLKRNVASKRHHPGTCHGGYGDYLVRKFEWGGGEKNGQREEGTKEGSRNKGQEARTHRMVRL